MPSTTPGGTSLPNYAPAVTGTDPTASIWNLPKDLAGQVLWYDTSHTSAQVQNRLAYANPEAKRVGPEGASSMVQTPVETIMAEFAAMDRNDPTRFREFQHNLYDAGWYGTSTKLPQPFWTTDTETALVSALQSYYQLSQTGVAESFKDWLAENANRARAAGTTPEQQAGGGAGGGAPSTPILTDPDTLANYAQKAAQAALGRALTPAEVNKFVAEFHGEQIQSYTDAAHHQGLSSLKDDPRASAIQYVAQANPKEYDQHQIQGYTDAFLNMFLPSGSQAPNVNTDPTAVAY